MLDIEPVRKRETLDCRVVGDLTIVEFFPFPSQLIVHPIMGPGRPNPTSREHGGWSFHPLIVEMAVRKRRVIKFQRFLTLATLYSRTKTKFVQGEYCPLMFRKAFGRVGLTVRTWRFIR